MEVDKASILWKLDRMNRRIVKILRCYLEELQRLSRE